MPRALMPTRSASSSCVRPAAARYVLRSSPKEETGCVAIASVPLWNFSPAPMRTCHDYVFSLYHTLPCEGDKCVGKCVHDFMVSAGEIGHTTDKVAPRH